MNCGFVDLFTIIPPFLIPGVPDLAAYWAKWDKSGSLQDQLSARWAKMNRKLILKVPFGGQICYPANQDSMLTNNASGFHSFLSNTDSFCLNHQITTNKQNAYLTNKWSEKSDFFISLQLLTLLLVLSVCEVLCTFCSNNNDSLPLQSGFNQQKCSFLRMLVVDNNNSVLRKLCGFLTVDWPVLTNSWLTSTH